jgi:RimJ/RimL family protein N-acetyltransferase
VVVTDRLVLREWRDADLEPFVAMNAEPVVMQFFPETYTEERTRRFIARIRECWAERGYGLWAVEPRAALAYAFDTLGIEEIVSFTSGINIRSVRVMERRGMLCDVAGNLEHPNVPES